MTISPPPVPVERALSIYIEKQCTWKEVSYYLHIELGYFWDPSTINSAVNRFRAGTPRREVAWRDEKIEILKARWNKASAAKIAIEIGFTRNAVIGMAHRLGLAKGRKPPPPPRAFERRPRPRAPSKSPWLALWLPRAKAEYVPGTGVPLLELQEHQCKWALNDLEKGRNGLSGQYFFCGEQRDGELPYCEQHADMAYREPGR